MADWLRNRLQSDYNPVRFRTLALVKNVNIRGEKLEILLFNKNGANDEISTYNCDLTVLLDSWVS